MDVRLRRWLKEVDVWFIDLDGTLVHSTPYRKAVLELVAHVTGVPYATLLRRYRNEWHGVDEAREYHYSLATNDGQRDHIRLAYNLYAVDSHTPTIIPGAFSFTERLRALHKHLVCYTRGVHSWQMAKLQSTGLTTLFQDICIVEKKDVEMFRMHTSRIAQGRPVVMMGNSFVEDIAPAKDIAAGRIYVTDDPHSVDERKPQHIPGDVLVINSAQDLVQPIAEFQKTRS